MLGWDGIKKESKREHLTYQLLVHFMKQVDSSQELLSQNFLRVGNNWLLTSVFLTQRMVQKTCKTCLDYMDR